MHVGDGIRHDFEIDVTRSRFENGQKFLRKMRVELAARKVLDLIDCGRASESSAVGAVAAHRVERVDDGDDARRSRDRFSLQSIRVTRSVPPLVVVLDRRDDCVRNGEWLDEPRTDGRMLLDERAFARVERPRSEQKICWHADLSEVV